MLTDRGYTFPIRKFQTSLHSFVQLQTATRSLPVLLEHMRIHGTTSSAPRPSRAKTGKTSVDEEHAQGIARTDTSSSAPANGGALLETNQFLVHFAASVCVGGGGGGVGGGNAGGGAGGHGRNGRNGNSVRDSGRAESGLVVPVGSHAVGSHAVDAAPQGSDTRSAPPPPALPATAATHHHGRSHNGNTAGSGGNSSSTTSSTSSVNSSSEASFGKQQAEAVLAYMRTNNITRLLLVTGSAVTAPAQKLLESAVHVEYWPVIACLSCAETHCTVPKCRRLTTREKKEFYAKHGIAATNLPRMLLADRMSRYWDFQVGDLVEFARLTHVGVVRGEVRVVTHA